MDATPLSTAKRKTKAVKAMSPFLVFAIVCFLAATWHLVTGSTGGPRRRGFDTPIRFRENHPVEFWSFVGLEALLGIILLAFAIRRYFKVRDAFDRRGRA